MINSARKWSKEMDNRKLRTVKEFFSANLIARDLKIDLIGIIWSVPGLGQYLHIDDLRALNSRFKTKLKGQVIRKIRILKDSKGDYLTDHMSGVT